MAGSRQAGRHVRTHTRTLVSSRLTSSSAGLAGLAASAAPGRDGLAATSSKESPPAPLALLFAADGGGEAGGHLVVAGAGHGSTADGFYRATTNTLTALLPPPAQPSHQPQCQQERQCRQHADSPQAGSQPHLPAPPPAA